MPLHPAQEGHPGQQARAGATITTKAVTVVIMSFTGISLPIRPTVRPSLSQGAG